MVQAPVARHKEQSNEHGQMKTSHHEYQMAIK
jgi:hypothetical protein